MKNYKKDEIPDSLVKKVGPMLEKPEIQIKNVEKASKALVAVHVWVSAMVKYYETLKIVGPKRETVRVMGIELEKVQAQLNEKRAILKEVNDKIESLQNQFAQMVQQEKDLNKEIGDCKAKLVRAEKLIKGLEGEKIRWTETSKQLGIKKDLLIGDCLIAAGGVAYNGPFTSEYRGALEEEWRKKVESLNIIHSKGAKMGDVLGDEVL